MRDRLLPIVLLLLVLIVPACLLGAPPAETSGQEKESGKECPSADRGSKEDNPYEKRFRELDRNQDGYVSLAEWPLDPPRFHRVDRNKDGRLSRHELLTPNVLREYGPRPLEPGNTTSRRVTPQAERSFRKLDRNRDNYLSRLEWTGLESRFDYLDLNRDGFISLYTEWPRQQASPPVE
jgi:Ca2+-binding EF-hand superfamily protein